MFELYVEWTLTQTGRTALKILQIAVKAHSLRTMLCHITMPCSLVSVTKDFSKILLCFSFYREILYFLSQNTRLTAVVM